MIKYFDFQERKIAYRLSRGGAGVPMVLLHGFCEDSRIWQDWLSFLPGRPYVLVDLPGFGGSGYAANLSMERMAEDVKALLDHLSIKKCVLVGHSMGGYVGLAFAGRYAERLAGLCLFHSHPFADPAEKKAGRLKSIEFIQKNGHILFVRQLFPGLFADAHLNRYKKVVDKLIHHAANYAPEAIIAALEAMRNRPDRSEVLRDLPCPVLFFIGKSDEAVPLELSLAQAHLPAMADIRMYPKVGHFGMYEAQRETAEAMREFLDNIAEG